MQYVIQTSFLLSFLFPSLLFSQTEIRETQLAFRHARARISKATTRSATVSNRPRRFRSLQGLTVRGSGRRDAKNNELLRKTIVCAENVNQQKHISRRTKMENKRLPEIVAGPILLCNFMDKELIRRVVRQHHPEIRSCYESILEKSSNLEGRTVVHFTISSEGNVSEVRVKPSLRSDLKACMIQHIRKWKFAKRPGGGITRIHYPFIFKRGPDKTMSELEEDARRKRK